MGKIAEALRATADLPPDERIEAMLATVQASPQAEVAAAGVNLRSVVHKLQARNRVLQTALQAQYVEADHDLPAFVEATGAALASNASVVRAVDTYNDEWFRRLPFSPAGKKNLAQEMLARAAPFGHRPPVWVNWSRGRGA